jgi:hypothetical protein
MLVFIIIWMGYPTISLSLSNCGFLWYHRKYWFLKDFLLVYIILKGLITKCGCPHLESIRDQVVLMVPYREFTMCPFRSCGSWKPTSFMFILLKVCALAVLVLPWKLAI